MKNKLLSIAFSIFIFGFMILNFLMPKEEVSYSERRKLAKLPTFTIENILNGKVTNSFESYALDHFPYRDEFRSIKALSEFNIFRKQDFNNLYVDDGYIFKNEYPLKEDKVLKFTEKLNKVYDTYLIDSTVYYSLIPDKSYYYENNHLNLDFDSLYKIINKNIDSNIKYIDIRESLSLEDYYRTDIHWRQDKLDMVIDVLSREMGFQVGDGYEKRVYKPFYGSYYGQIGLKVEPDSIVYLTNDVIYSASVYDIEDKIKLVYDIGAAGKMDSYDLFLGGATPIVKVTNNYLDSGKDLVIFRDSFGSSIAPLMLDGYKSITLVDLRYIDASLIGDYVEFKNSDVLFLYNTTIINNSDIIKA